MTIDHAARIAQDVESMMAPLRQHYDDLGREIDEHEQAVRDLRRVRGTVRTLIRAADPDFEKRDYGNGKNGKGSRAGLTPSGAKMKLSHAAVDELGDWLAERGDEVNSANEGKGFFASGLVRDYADDLPPAVKRQSPMSQALSILHDQGRIRLVSSGSGGRKYFRVMS